MYSFDEIANFDPEIAQAMTDEINRQDHNIELIASENIVSKAVMAAMGSPLTNKYAEGYPGKRYYGGCEYVDVVEDLARERAKKLFGCEYVNVQPHSGAQANMAVFFAILQPGDTFMGMNLAHGGHLTHGSPVNMSGKYFNVVPYGVNDDGFIDYDEVLRIAKECKPKMIVAGASAYARAIDFKRFREIADEVGAYLMVDIAHIAGLVAAGLHESPIPYAHVTTTTTHKTLRGPRGGMILSSNEVNEKYNFNKAVFPGIQGGPLMHVIAGKAVCLKEALTDEYKEYQKQVVKNAACLAQALTERGFKIVSGGTDNHLMLVDLQNLDLTGGTFYLESNLAYMRNFGDNSATQLTSVPIRIGYSQSLVGYNPFKWERKIEPLKYERVKKEFLYNVEKVSETATSYFFSLAMAQAEYNLAKENLASTDTLYRIGQQRHRIAAISQADLLTLKLDRVNAQNTLQNKASDLKRAMFSLASFLNLDKNTQIELELPSRPGMLEIPIDEALRWGRSNNPQLLELKQNVLEAERNVDKTKKESRFNASVNASIGFNQVADNFGDVYHKPMQQDLVAVSVSIPLLDWGVRKGKYNMARNNLNVVKISARQDEISIEEEVIMTVSDFNIQQQLIASAEEALDLSILAYNETKQRFIIGKADINSLTLSLNRQQQAQRNFISALQNYWLNYYKIRRLTLFDFATKLSLSDRFDFNGGKLIK